eukprot:gene10391-16004_t
MAEKVSEETVDSFLAAAEKGDVAALSKLHRRCADEAGRPDLHVDLIVDAGSMQGAWHAAASAGQVAALEWLSDNGGRPDVRDKDGCTAVHFAAADGRLHVLEWLKAHGHDLRAIDYHDMTPAAYSGMTGQAAAKAWLESSVNTREEELSSLFGSEHISPGIWREAAAALLDPAHLPHPDPLPWLSAPAQRSLAAVACPPVGVVGGMLFLSGEFQLGCHAFRSSPAFSSAQVEPPAAEDAAAWPNTQAKPAAPGDLVEVSMAEYTDTQGVLAVQCFCLVGEDALREGHALATGGQGPAGGGQAAAMELSPLLGGGLLGSDKDRRPLSRSPSQTSQRGSFRGSRRTASSAAPAADTPTPPAAAPRLSTSSTDRPQVQAAVLSVAHAAAKKLGPPAGRNPSSSFLGSHRSLRVARRSASTNSLLDAEGAQQPPAKPAPASPAVPDARGPDSAGVAPAFGGAPAAPAKPRAPSKAFCLFPSARASAHLQAAGRPHAAGRRSIHSAPPGPPSVLSTSS